MPADTLLTSRLDELLGARHRVVAAATVTPHGVRLAARGAGLQADYEIGSVAKGLTGMLYRDAVDRGEVRPDTTLGALLPLQGTPAADVTLASLAVHRSGLPRLPPAMRPYRSWLRYQRTRANPYGDSLATLIEHTRGTKVGSPRPRYSNLGFELLGHAVAAAAGCRYAELVRSRLAEPLGIELLVPATAGELGPSSVIGTSRRGRPVEPWTGEALGPAGGIRATVGAMAELLAALLHGTAPGVTALDPVATLAGPAVRIGAGWVVAERHHRVVAWHNGGTGGFRSWVGVDRGARTGAVVLSATSRSVDRAGFALLETAR